MLRVKWKTHGQEKSGKKSGKKEKRKKKEENGEKRPKVYGK